MAIVHIIYAAALAFAGAIALTLLSYGVLDYVRRSNRASGVIEAVAGGVLATYLLVFHLDGFTHNVARQVSHGGLVSTSYVLGPALLGLVTADYLLRRIVPLVSGVVVPDDAGSGDRGERPVRDRIRSRRSVLGVTAGALTASQLGGLGFLRGTLQSPVPEGDDTAEFALETTFSAPYFPTALTFGEDGRGYLTTIEGKIFRFELPSPDQESIDFEQVASGIRFPQGVELFGDTLYTVDNGSAASGKYGMEKGYEVLGESNGKVVAFDVASDGSLTNQRTVVSGLPVVNSQHALHQITAGPDDRLYLSVGHLGGRKYPEMFENEDYEPTGERHPGIENLGGYDPNEEDHPGYEYLGTVISFEPDGSDVEIVASGLRNVYDLAFDQNGNLFGANNDGMSIRSKVWESLCHITEGAYFGYPEYGTFDSPPEDVEVTDPLWVLDGFASTGVETTDKLGQRDGVVVALNGKVVFVPVESGEDGVYVPEFMRPEPTVIELNDRPVIVEAGPDGFLWVGTSGRDDLLSMYRPRS